MFKDGVYVIPLRDIDEEQSTRFDDTDVLTKKLPGIILSEMLEETLVKNYIE